MSASSRLCCRMLDEVLDDDNYASLHDADPGESGEAELAGGSYDRQPLFYHPAKDGGKELADDLVFKNLPKRSGIGWVGVWDSKSGGKFLWGVPLVDPQDTNAGSTIIIPAGSMNHTVI